MKRKLQRLISTESRAIDEFLLSNLCINLLHLNNFREEDDGKNMMLSMISRVYVVTMLRMHFQKIPVRSQVGRIYYYLVWIAGIWFLLHALDELAVEIGCWILMFFLTTQKTSFFMLQHAFQHFADTTRGRYSHDPILSSNLFSFGNFWVGVGVGGVKPLQQSV